MIEEWRDIDGYENYYQVSNFGRVKRKAHFSNYKGSSKRYIPEIIKKLSTDKDGYKVVSLYIGKSNKLCKVHILVAKAFIPNDKNLPQVNHKDENKGNNFADNLEWCTCHYNNNYGTRNERVSKTKKLQGKCYCKTRDAKGRFCKKGDE